jgi:hypothetical protein
MLEANPFGVFLKLGEVFDPERRRLSRLGVTLIGDVKHIHLLGRSGGLGIERVRVVGFCAIFCNVRLSL